MTAQRALSHLPPAELVERDLPPTGLLVGTEQLLTGSAAERRSIDGAEAPGPYAHPAEVLGAVPGVHRLPIDHSAKPLLTDDQIRQAEISVHH